MVLQVGVLFFCQSCSPKSTNAREVVIYTSSDRPHSEPLLRQFEQLSGIRVRAVYDTEASKTVGLVNRLLSESSRPQADVFWNSEVARTLMLKERGVLAPYISPSASDIPGRFKDPEGYWTGFAARARVLLYNTDLVQTPPRSLRDLASPAWKAKTCIGSPLFGTTNTQTAVWCLLWGPERTRAWLQSLKANQVAVAAGNAQARDMVAAGLASMCLTDTDDAYGAIRNGRPVRMVYPDQEEGEGGTLLIPNTVALIARGPNPEAGKQLIDFLLSRKVEEWLAASESAQIPLRTDVPHPEHVKTIGEIRVTEVDYAEAAKKIQEASALAQEIFFE